MPTWIEGTVIFQGPMYGTQSRAGKQRTDDGLLIQTECQTEEWADANYPVGSTAANDLIASYTTGEHQVGFTPS